MVQFLEGKNSWGHLRSNLTFLSDVSRKTKFQLEKMAESSIFSLLLFLVIIGTVPNNSLQGGKHENSQRLPNQHQVRTILTWRAGRKVWRIRVRKLQEKKKDPKEKISTRRKHSRCLRRKCLSKKKNLLGAMMTSWHCVLLGRWKFPPHRLLR